MDELAITSEELAQAVGTASNEINTDPSPTNSERPRQARTGGGTKAIARPVEFAPLQPASSVSSSTNLELLLGVTLLVTVELGRARMSIEEVLKLGPGSVVELDKQAGEPVDVLVNDRLVARGEVVVIDDRFGVRITDVLPPAQRINSLR